MGGRTVCEECGHRHGMPDQAACPVISVIVPTWNSGPFLAAALDSLLSQTYPFIEIIVVDDGSSDGTDAVLTRYRDRVRILSFREREGAWHARNAGAAAAQGSLIAFHDADDISVPRRFDLQIDALRKDPTVAVVFGAMEEFSHASGLSGRVVSGICPGTMLTTKAFFECLGCFSVEWELAGFMEWYARLLDGGHKSVCISEVVTKRRLHPANSGAGKWQLLARESWQVLRRRARARHTAS